MFLAPTRPLVAQQVDACYRFMGVSHTAMAELTGAWPCAPCCGWNFNANAARLSSFIIDCQLVCPPLLVPQARPRLTCGRRSGRSPTPASSSPPRRPLRTTSRRVRRGRRAGRRRRLPQCAVSSWGLLLLTTSIPTADDSWMYYWLQGSAPTTSSPAWWWTSATAPRETPGRWRRCGSCASASSSSGCWGSAPRPAPSSPRSRWEGRGRREPPVRVCSLSDRCQAFTPRGGVRTRH